MSSLKSIPCFKLADLDNLNSDLLDASDKYVVTSPDHFTVSIVSLSNTSKCLKLRFAHKISRLILITLSSQRNLLLILFEDGPLLFSEFSENLNQGVFLTNNNSFIHFSQKLLDLELDAKHDSTHTSILLHNPQFSALLMVNHHGPVPTIIVRNLPFGLTVPYILFFRIIHVIYIMKTIL